MSNGFYKINLTNGITVTDLITVHYFKYSKTFDFSEGESHNFYEFIYVDSGEIEITNGGENYTLKQNEAFIHRPDIFHTIRAKDAFSNMIIVTFDSADLKDYAVTDRIIKITSEAEKSLLSEIVHEAEETFNEPLDIVDLKKMTTKSTYPLLSKQIIKNNIEKLLIYICRKNTDNNLSENHSAKQQIIDTVVSFLEKNSDKNLTIADISKGCGYSTPYLKKLFPPAVGMGVIRFFNNLKIKKAKQLIAEDIYNFEEISDMLSFASPQYFSAAFRKYTNMSPSEYKKSVKLLKLLK